MIRMARAARAISLAVTFVTTARPAQIWADPPAPTESVASEQIAPATSQGASAAVAARLDMPQVAHPERDTLLNGSEISTPADSRALSTEALTGADTCDSQARSHTELCGKRLESRAGEFARPRPAQVSAEGRLLLLINPAVTPSNGASAGHSAVETPSSLNSPNGPAQQLAGALQGYTGGEDPMPGDPGRTASAKGIPTDVPAIVVLPGGK